MAKDFTLQALGFQDAADVFRLWGDIEVVKYTHWAHTPTLEDCTNRLERVLAAYAKDPLHFGPYSLRTESGAFLGLIGADHSTRVQGTYEVWYTLTQENWGKGIASRALAGLLEQMIFSGRVSNAVASAVLGNPASARVLEKNGFLRRGPYACVTTRHGSFDIVNFQRAFGPATPPAPTAP